MDHLQIIEAKLDQAVELIVRLDERSAAMESNFAEFESNTEDRISRLEARVTQLERWQYTVIGAGLFAGLVMGDELIAWIKGLAS